MLRNCLGCQSHAHQVLVSGDRLTSAQVAVQDLLRVHVRHALRNLQGCMQNDTQSGNSSQVDIVVRFALLQEDPFRHGGLQEATIRWVGQRLYPYRIPVDNHVKGGLRHLWDTRNKKAPILKISKARVMFLSVL